jgi:peptide/nickel transport system substrate-binding protein
LIAAGAIALMLVAAIPGNAPAQGPGEPPSGQLTWGLHFSPTPTLYEPAETPGLITPFMFLYALHDALAKPMPGKSISPSLAESWTTSADGLVYEFVLRKGVKFHNGDLVTAEDVKYSFERYRGISAKVLKDRMAAVEVVDPGRVRFRLKQPWADFLTFYATPATGAAWIVPKKYVEKVGEEGFKKAPIGAGPYRFVSFNPGVELVLEAFDGYWRKTPSVKRLVFKSVPDPATRLAMLKTGEADIVLRSGRRDRRRSAAHRRAHAQAHAVHEHALASLRRSVGAGLALARPARSAGRRPRGRSAGDQSGREPGLLQDLRVHHSRQLRLLLAAAGDCVRPGQGQAASGRGRLPEGLRCGDFWCDAATSRTAEAVLNYLQAVGIKTKLRPVERAGFMKSYQEKKLKNIIYGLSGIAGNAATRIEPYATSGGIYAYGGYPDIDGLFKEQVAELDHKKREVVLHRVQQLIHDKVMFLPIWQLVVLNAHGSRVAESGLGLITDYPWSAPYEDVKVKPR